MPDLLLVGAGHAHLHLMLHAADLTAAGYRVRVLAPRWFHYSGMASAVAAGALPAHAERIDVRALASAHGVELVEDTLVDLDPISRVATTSSGERLTYDVASLNLGSVAADAGLAVGEGVLRVKPLSDLAALSRRLDDLDGAIVTIIGGGATGLELASHLALREGVTQVRLVEAGDRVGADLPERARRRLLRLLDDRGVEVLTGTDVREVAEDHVVLADGRSLPHDVALLATGLVAPPLLAHLGLGDADGVPVTAALHHPEHPELYAAGDCAHFTPQPLPRVGVHGVRQGPVLLASLLARAAGDPLPTYSPQRRVLSVLDLGGGIGLAVRGRLWWWGTGALRLKRWIDGRWLRNYR